MTTYICTMLSETEYSMHFDNRNPDSRPIKPMHDAGKPDLELNRRIDCEPETKSTKRRGDDRSESDLDRIRKIDRLFWDLFRET